jgi:hypothetical protein
MVAPREVIFIGVKDISTVSSISRKSKHLSDVNIRCRIDYYLEISLARNNFDSAANAVSIVTNTIATAVSTGKFDSKLTYYAAAMQAPNLLRVTSSSVAVVGVETSSSEGTSNQTVEDNGYLGAVFGLIIVGLLLTGIIIYVSWPKVKEQFRKATGNYDQVLNTDSTHSTFNPVLQQQDATNQDDDVEMEIELSSSLRERIQVENNANNSQKLASIKAGSIKSTINQTTVNPLVASPV